MGSLLGAVLSLTNLYMGLKTGWGFGVAITACILSYALWTGLFRMGLVRTPDDHSGEQLHAVHGQFRGLLDGRNAGFGLRGLHALEPRPLPIPLTLGWVFFLAVLGVTMAIPMKRQMINIEQLRFPSGIAAAETLRALHSHGEKGMRAGPGPGHRRRSGRRQPVLEGRALASSSSRQPGALFHRCPGRPVQRGRCFGKAWMDRTVMFDWDPVFIAAGALTGMRASASMLLGGTFVGPSSFRSCNTTGSSPDPGYQRCRASGPSGAASPAWSPPACSRSPCNGGARCGHSAIWEDCSRGEKAGRPSEMDAIEVPASWFLAGQLVGLVGLAWLAKRPSTCLSGRAFWPSCSPSSGPGGVPRYGRNRHHADRRHGQGHAAHLRRVLSPGNMNVNLMSANITAGAACRPPTS